MKPKCLLGLMLVLIMSQASSIMAAIRPPTLLGNWSGTVTAISAEGRTTNSCVLKINQQDGGYFFGTLDFGGTSPFGEYAISGVISPNGVFTINGGYLAVGSLFYKFEGSGKHTRPRTGLKKLTGSWSGVMFQFGAGAFIEAISTTFDFTESPPAP